MKSLKSFIIINRIILLGMISGLGLGYIHWYYWGCYWGTYPLSSECFTNCIYGILTGGLFSSILTSQKEEI